MHDITPQEFLQTIFEPAGDDEQIVVCHPAFFMKDGERHDYFKNYDGRTKRRFPRNEWYYCVSTAGYLPGGKIQRKLANLKHAYALVLDDIDTKAEPPGISPHYILESSEGNKQWGYLLEPWDVSTHRGASFYDSCLYGLAVAGHNDIGCRSASRVMRLPGSLHKTGFEARMIRWVRPHDDPERWHLETLMSAFDVEPVKPPRSGGGVVRPGKYTDIKDVQDPVLDFLKARGMLIGNNQDWQYIVCPWRHEHTEGKQNATSTAYSPLDYSRGGRQFRCLHGHCADRGIAELLAWVAAVGGPNVVTTATDRRGPFYFPGA